MNTQSRAVAITTVGYMCLALAGWMASMTWAAWYAVPYAASILYPFAIVLGVMGIFAFLQNRGLDAIVFFGGAALFWSAYAYHSALAESGVTEPRTYLGWFSVVWAVFFCYVWLGSFRSGVTRMLFLLGAWLTLLALAIGDWSGAQGFIILGGYLGLITSIVAAITSANGVIRYGMTGNPNLEAPGTTARPIAAD